MGLPTVLFYQYGYFDEYDYWAGTVSLVIFALLEIILFAWVFGMTKGWEEITRGADIRIPLIYKFIIKYITPVLLLMVLIGALFTPLGNEWATAISGSWENNGWALDNSSLISKITLEDLKTQLVLHPEDQELIENRMFYTQMARIQLLLLFVFISIVVWFSTKKRKLEGRL